MSTFATEQAEVLLEMVLLLCLCELAVFFELQGEVGVGLLLVSIATTSISVTRVTGVTGVTLSTVIIFILIGVLSGVCFFIALPFIIRAFVLVGGWILSGHRGMALPISGVDRLGEGTEFMEGVRFADVGNIILDAGWKSVIHLSAEGSITPLDTGGKAVEVDQVLHDALVIVHLEVFKVSFGLTFGIMGSEVVFLTL